MSNGIDRTKIDDIGVLAAAIIEQQIHGQLCPAIMEELNKIFEEHMKEKENGKGKEN